MKTLKVLLLLFFCLSINSCYSEQIQQVESNLEITNKEHLTSIEKYVSSFPNNTTIAIAIIDNNSTNYYGIVRENDTLKSVINKEKVFEIGSISKVFTSAILSHYVTNKTVDLTDEIGTFFDFNIKDGEKITLQHLANHTSGLAKMPSNITINYVTSKNPYKSYTPELLEIYLKEKILLENEIGEKYSYSNLGAGLLGYIITKKTNKGYEELLQEIICIPLKMNNTTILRENIDKNNLVNGLNEKGNITPNWDITDALVGAGGIKSTIIDLEKFVRKSFEDDVIYNLTHKKTFTINDKMSMGLGWHLFSKNNILWHNGGTGGYKSCLAFNKQKKKAVIILSNVSGLSKEKRNIDKLCFKLINSK